MTYTPCFDYLISIIISMLLTWISECCLNLVQGIYLDPLIAWEKPCMTLVLRMDLSSPYGSLSDILLSIILLSCLLYGLFGRRRSAKVWISKIQLLHLLSLHFPALYWSVFLFLSLSLSPCIIYWYFSYFGIPINSAELFRLFICMFCFLITFNCPFIFLGATNVCLRYVSFILDWKDVDKFIMGKKKYCVWSGFLSNKGISPQHQQ